MTAADMTGLDLMRAMIAGEIDHPHMADTIPMKGVSANEGHVVFEVVADKRHLNPMGGVHGGFAATVIDTVTGCAVHTVMSSGVGYSTIDLNVKMVRPIPLDIPLIAEGNLINKSRRLAIADGVIKDENGKIYATGSATCIVLT